MSFTIAVYSTSNNWKDRATKLNSDLNDVKKERDALKNRFEELEKSVQEQLAAAGNIIGALSTQIEIFETEKRESNAMLAQLRSDIDETTRTIALTHKSLNAAQAEQTELRSVFRQTQRDWTELLSDFVKKTDEAHELSMKLDALETVSQELVKQYNNAKTVLGQFGLKPIPELYTGVPPFQVTGRVTEVRETGLVEITIGEDSGLQKGHQLDVYTKSEDGRDIYRGVVEVLLTEPNRAACKILPEYRKGTVQVNDVVTSEFSQERQKYQIKRDAHVATTIN